MSVLNKIAFYQNRRDEVPNQELARQLADSKDQAGIGEIAEHLWDKEQNVQSDCLKVLYETGYLDPSLIADYTEDFLKLLKHRNNRMVWGAMIALSTIAELKADEIFPHVEEIKKTMAAGSVITNDAGIRTLAGVASRKGEYRLRILPYLLERFANSRPVDAPRYAEFILAATGTAEKTEFIGILEKWVPAASGQRLARLRKVLKAAQKL
jgi:hypothetical protein